MRRSWQPQEERTRPDPYWADYWKKQEDEEMQQEWAEQEAAEEAEQETEQGAEQRKMSWLSDRFRVSFEDSDKDEFGRYIPVAGNRWPHGSSAREQALWLRDFAEHLAISESVTWDDYKLINLYLDTTTILEGDITITPTDDPEEQAFFRDSLAQAAFEASAFTGPRQTQRTTHHRHEHRISFEDALFWASLCVGQANGLYEVDEASWHTAQPLE